ncbi:MAG: helix-turn-helix transcriptional regulator [Mycobacteriales bacterium]|nr:helix-turn-helix transcriptional regulator [Mycobacteriales bacterium]
MDVAEVVWQARVAAGLSQRALAAAAGMSRGTVGDIESGRRQAAWASVSRLLEACGLELAVAPPAPALDASTRRYLQMSTSDRLWSSLNGMDRDLNRRRLSDLDVWVQLDRLTSRNTVSLAPRACVGVWLRHPAPVPLPVVVHRDRLPAGEWSALTVTLDPAPPARHLIPVGLHPQRRGVRVLTPVALALRPEVAEHAAQLRAVARHLHREEGFDRARRHRPAHRVSDPIREGWDVLQRHAYGTSNVEPSSTARREWRASSSVSFSQWLTRNGYQDPRYDWRRQADADEQEEAG